MQKYDTLYGLTVDCKPDEHIQYGHFKDFLEKVFHPIGNKVAHKNFVDMQTSMVRIPGSDLRFSFCMIGNHFKLGIYDPKTKMMRRNTTYSELKAISGVELKRMTFMAENTMNRTQTICMSNALDTAWKKELEREKLRAVEEKKKKEKEKKNRRPWQPCGEILNETPLEDGSKREEVKKAVMEGMIRNGYHNITAREFEYMVDRAMEIASASRQTHSPQEHERGSPAEKKRDVR